MSSVGLQVDFSSVSKAYETCTKYSAKAAHDLNKLVEKSLNTVIDQGTHWGINPVAALISTSAAGVMAFSGLKGYLALTNKNVVHVLGWSVPLALTGKILFHAAPKLLCLK